MAFTAAMKCVVCNTPNGMSCVQCKSAHYCSRACQADDWPTHKLMCKRFANFDLDSRPSPDHVVGIYFPVTGKPKPVWLKLIWNGEGWSVPYQGFLGPDPTPEFRQLEFNRPLKRKLTREIEIAFRDNFMNDGSRPNESYDMMAANRQVPKSYTYRNPFIAWRFIREWHGPKVGEDLNADDFRHVVDFLLAPPEKSSGVNLIIPALMKGPREARAVLVNCEGDRKIHSKPAFETVSVPVTTELFANPRARTSDIADRVGMPILIGHFAPDSDIAGLPGAMDNANDEFLHQSLTTQAKYNTIDGEINWGDIPDEVKHHRGQAIVARKDQRPLGCWDLEALSRYCQEVVKPLIEDAKGRDDEAIYTKDEVLKMISRDAFREFHAEVVSEKFRTGVVQKEHDFYNI